MMVTVESWLRKAMGWLRRVTAPGWVRKGLRGLLWSLRGLILAAVGLRLSPQPLALGAVLGPGDWRGIWAALGAGVGYRLFWGQAGEQGVLWALGGGLLCTAMLKEDRLRRALAALLVAGSGLWFRLAREDGTALSLFVLRILVGLGAVWLFQQRSRLGRWLRCGVWGLALAQGGSALGLGFGWAAAAAVAWSFPAGVLAAAGVDLARVTAVPMTAAVALGWLARLYLPDKRLRPILLLGAGLGIMVVTNVWEVRLLIFLGLGGLAGLLLPEEPHIQPHTSTGQAQVRLELASETLAGLGRTLHLAQPREPDRQALLQRVRDRACGGCALRHSCQEQKNITITALEDIRAPTCRKSHRLRQELSRGREQLRQVTADCRRREEYRRCLAGEYAFLGQYLHQLADSLPRSSPRIRCRYGITVSVRTQGAGRDNGDRWGSFPGEGCYYVLLCDGMGTGPAARAEGDRALKLVKTMLQARISPEQALGSLNHQLALTGRAGAVTVDLARIRLDSGAVCLYKWGAAPSWLISPEGVEKLGAPGPPPGLAVEEPPPPVKRRLCRGETLVMVSDGVAGEDLPRRVALASGAPPGVLAQRLLEGAGTQDDATAAVIRLYDKGK